jgi:hypothetical protein
LAAIICELLRIGQKEISKPIEIEFAMNLSPAPGMPKVFSFLQIRPIVDNNVICDVIPEKINLSDTIVYCESALGNGHIDNIYHIVYVKPQAFDAGRSTEIVSSVAHINQLMGDAKLHFILIGPGRWGSSDPWLGIPVNWPQISNAKIIVEAGLKNYRIDPSQGTHFFQNLTSFNVGYFTINPFIGEGSYALDFLDAQEADSEDEFVRHIRFELPIEAKIDGKNNRGVIFRPGYKQTRTENESEDIPPEGFC